MTEFSRMIRRFWISTFAAAFVLMSIQTVWAEMPYQVDGNKVDSATYKGYQTYKRQRCETCHGQTAEGSAAFPNLLTALKNKSKEEFVQIVSQGKAAMPAHKDNKAVMDNIDGLYAYLKGRSDGAIPAGELQEMK